MRWSIIPSGLSIGRNDYDRVCLSFALMEEISMERNKRQRKRLSNEDTTNTDEIPGIKEINGTHTKQKVCACVAQQQRKGDRTSTHGHLSIILAVDYLTLHAYKNCHLPLSIVIPNTHSYVHVQTSPSSSSILIFINFTSIHFLCNHPTSLNPIHVCRLLVVKITFQLRNSSLPISNA
jgi:hypothetical protein